MRLILFFVLCLNLSCGTQPQALSKAKKEKSEKTTNSVETMVLETIRQMIRLEGGRVIFSDLYNDNRFSPKEKTFVGQLYETFFLIPGYLKTMYTAEGAVPPRKQIGENFGISTDAVEGLLQIMEREPRMPKFFTRNSSTKEISSINLEVIGAFISHRGQSVRVTNWEGQELPDFTLQRLDRTDSLSRSSLLGGGALIYFWFSGCPPCVRLAPHLAELDRKYRAKGFQIVGFNADTILNISITDKKRDSYLAKIGATFPNLHLTRQTQADFGNINVYPTIFVVDPTLKIRRHLINYQTLETLDKTIKTVFED